MTKAGRPKFQFTETHEKIIRAWARAHVSDDEIASEIGCGEKTLKRHYRKQLHEWRQAGVGRLRAKQYKLAMEGDKTMLIWVGKQIAGQTDRVHQDTEVTAKFTSTTIHRLNGEKVVLGTELLKNPKKKNDG